MRLNLTGDVFGMTGYSAHSRQLFRAIMKQLSADDVVRIEAAIPPNIQQVATDEEYKAVGVPYDIGMTTVFIGQPPYSPAMLSKNPRHFVQFVVWEGSHTPLFWNKYLMNPKIEQLWVPSQHVKSAILKSCPEVESKIRLVPHGVDFTKFYPRTEKKKDGVPFCFFYNKGWSRGVNDRGGMQFVIKAFREEFSGDEKVELRLKINPCYHDQSWDLLEEIKKLQIKDKNPKRQARVFVNMDNVVFDDLIKFYHEADVFVAPTMCEGFGLTMAEAMACGLPCITSDFGGQIDFINPENGWIVPTSPIEVTWDLSYEGVFWGMPDINKLREAMREAFEKREILCSKKEKALKDIKEWSWDNSAVKAVKALKELKD